MSAPSVYQLFVGVDIAATTFTATWTTSTTPSQRPQTFTQTAAGFTALQQGLQATGVPPAATLLVLEATGSYWITLATTLHAAGYAVSVINPRQAHHFAKALLKRAKSDAIDATTLTQLAALLQPAAWTPPPPVYHELQQRLAQRATLVGMRTHLRTQRQALLQGPVVIAAVRQRLDRLLETLNAQIAEVEGELAAALQMDAAWARAAERVLSITGVGLITAGWLLVATLNFSICCTPEQATAYAGLAPREWQSGTSVRRGKHIGHTGNARLRTALYLATISATRSNPVLRTFYTRLRAAGKRPKVARCAAARKLLHIAWAVATKDQPFDPSFKLVPPLATDPHILGA